MNKSFQPLDFSFLSALEQTDNIRKYSSRNPLIRIAVNSFISSFYRLIENCGEREIKKVLDAGTGEGIINYLAQEKFKNMEISGLDISLENLNIAKKIVKCDLTKGTVYNLPFKENSFDIVLSIEVLEHLTHPVLALKEIKRVTRKFAILSVPNDPIFRMGNILRGKNLSQFGNGPGHIQHFTERSFMKLIEEQFKIVVIRRPANLWIMCLAMKR